ncbi:conserved hypothetical protein [Gammaproteobacteria bacterium]
MQKNIGNIDRILRIVIGIVLTSLVFFGPKTVWGWIGLVPLATAFISFCPLYKIINFDTCAAPHSD